MGQTLTHGVYLPDEGERNCYAGLAANWQLLDNSVGTIADHTSQIAGKAPAVHTHTKSDVTNLFNSANEWSANQTIIKDSETICSLKRSNLKMGDAIPQITQILGTLAFTGSDGANAGLVTFRDNSNGDTSLVILVRQKYNSNGNRDPNGILHETRMDIGIDSSRNYYIRPNSNGNINLGTSTNKWKTLNGINPGALSLPSNSYTGSIAITEIDRTGWVYDGTVNTYSPPVDCWLSISNGGIMTVWGIHTAFGMKATDNIAIPLRQGETYNISLTHTPDFCRIYPCNGNV